MADEANRLARIGKLLDTLRELQAKTYEVTEELQKLATGQDGLGDVLKRLEKVYGQEFARLYGSKYAWDYAKDRAHWKRLLRAAPEGDIQARVIAYFHTPDDFTRQARHSFGVFIHRFNQLVPIAVPQDFMEDGDAPVGCTHTPPCKDDAEHTRRRRQDLHVG